MRFARWRAGKVGTVLRYGVALAAALALFSGAEVLEGLLGSAVLSVAVAGIALLSLALGAGPGLLATLVVGLGAWFFLLPIHGSFVLQSGHEAARLAGYFVASFTVVGAIELQHRARRRLRASLGELEALYETAPIGLCVFDENLRWVRANKIIAEINGRPIEEHIGRTPSEVVPAVGAQAEQALQTILRTGERLDFEMRGTTSAQPGVERSWAEHWVPMKDATGRIVGISVAAEEITDRKRAQDAQREASRQLLEADQRKTQFLAVLSHELRNPLTPIMNGIYILEHAVPGGEQATRALRMIDRQVQHMARLVDDLLDVTRISRGKINLKCERVDLTTLARGAAEDHREVFARSGIALDIEGTTQPLWVDGDPTRLAQLIGNLLHNAAKFTPAGGRTVLTIGAGGPGEALIRVRDDGAGMSPETLAEIFQPFVQAAQTLERTPGGLGLGLALVKGLTELHGGTVTARSDGEGKGSEFTVILPLAAALVPADAGDASGVNAPASAWAAAASG